ncbi:hypothetical protein R6Q59_010376 [Mikania micrantha]
MFYQEQGFRHLVKALVSAPSKVLLKVIFVVLVFLLRKREEIESTRKFGGKKVQIIKEEKGTNGKDERTLLPFSKFESSLSQISDECRSSQETPFKYLKCSFDLFSPAHSKLLPPNPSSELLIKPTRTRIAVMWRKEAKTTKIQLKFAKDFIVRLKTKIIY